MHLEELSTLESHHQSSKSFFLVELELEKVTFMHAALYLNVEGIAKQIRRAPLCTTSPWVFMVVSNHFRVMRRSFEDLAL